MIIVKLQGGLGNQLFQFAAGLALARRHSTTLKIDTSFLNADPAGHYTKRYLELNVFDIALEEATEEDLRRFPLQENRYIRKLKEWLPVSFDTHVFNERGHHYNTYFSRLPANTYLNGYWQSERYFKNCSTELRTLLRFKPGYVLCEAELERRIINTNSVSVHVRRGDYVSLSAANSFHGVCGPDYYRKAMALFPADTTFYVFSDDLEWCRENLHSGYCMEFIETPNAYTDFYLMSQCRHHIIANSSFSWWAAWLHNDDKKQVIAPRRWFASAATPDIYPDNWVRL